MLLVTSIKSFVEVDLKTMWRLPKTISFESFIQAWEEIQREDSGGFHRIL